METGVVLLSIILPPCTFLFWKSKITYLSCFVLQNMFCVNFWKECELFGYRINMTLCHLKGLATSKHVLPSGQNRSKHNKDEEVCFKMPGWFHFEFTSWLSSVTISGTLAAQNNVKPASSPAERTTFLRWTVSDLCMLHQRNKIKEAAGSDQASCDSAFSVLLIVTDESRILNWK